MSAYKTLPFSPEIKSHVNVLSRSPTSSSSSSSPLSDQSKSFLLSHLRDCEEAFERAADLLSITASFVNLIVTTQRGGGGIGGGTRFSLDSKNSRHGRRRGRDYHEDIHEDDTTLAFAAGLGLATHTGYDNEIDEGRGGQGYHATIGRLDDETVSNAIAQSAEVGVLTQARTSSILSSIRVPEDIVASLRLNNGVESSSTIKSSSSSSSSCGNNVRRNLSSLTDAAKLVIMITEAVGEVKSAQTQVEESMAIEAGGGKGCSTQ
jgi:hypothetical protein